MLEYKVVTPDEMSAMDAETIASGIPGNTLMEWAGEQCTHAIVTKCSPPDSDVLVLCGGGNNGGDGFVIARLLLELNYPVKVICPSTIEKMTLDCRLNYDRFVQLKGECYFMDNVNHKVTEYISTANIIVDALFGNGLKIRPLSPLYMELINKVNMSQAYVFAIDIPSGLSGKNGKHLGTAIKAQTTLAIQFIKTGCVLADGADYCGHIQVLNIGITEGNIRNLKQMVFDSDIKWPNKRLANTHKYSYGATHLMVGSEGMYGAGLLSAEAALRMGCGIVKSFVPKSDFPIMATRMMPEVMVMGYEDDPFKVGFDDHRTRAYLIGPGIGRGRNMENTFDRVFDSSVPTVVDADGLWHLSKQMNRLKQDHAPLVLTPHMGEFSKLTGLSVSTIEENPLEYGIQFAADYKVVLVLKGHHTLIFAPDGRVRINQTGNAGMATAGSGDVLAGMITGILAQGVDLMDAAVAGVFYHGCAGDYYAHHYNEETLTASDIIRALKYIIKVKDE